MKPRQETATRSRSKPLTLKKRKKWLSFLTDKDGMGQRDFLLLVSIGSYYGSTILAQIVSLFGVEVSDTYIALIDTQQPLAMVVVGGVMGAQAVETIGNKFLDNKKDQPPDIHIDPDITIEPKYEEDTSI